MQSTLALCLSLSMTAAPTMTTVAPLVAAATQPAEGAPSKAPSKATLDQIYTDAQIHVERYNTTGDKAQLQSARQLLDEWLRGHAQLYGYGQAAVDARAPVQQQVAAIDEQLGPAATPAATPAPAAEPPPTKSVPPDIAQRQRRSNAMLTSGLVLGAVGLSTVLFVGLPAYGLRNNALDNARQQEFYAEEEKYLRRARRRQNVMISTLAVGGAFTAAGLALVIAGAVGKSRVQRDLAFTPEVGPSFAGGTLRVRF
jgi:hypothetical protein